MKRLIREIERKILKPRKTNFKNWEKYHSISHFFKIQAENFKKFIYWKLENNFKQFKN